MKLPTSISIVTLALFGAFLAYSNHDGAEPKPLQANISESIPDKEPESPKPTQTPETLETVSQVEISSTDGLSEEWGTILEGYEAYQSDFDRLEPQKTATGAGN